MSPMRATYILSACVCIIKHLPPSFAHYQHGMLLPTYITHSEPYQVASSSPVKTEDKFILSHNKSPLPDWWKTPDSKEFPIKAFLFRALCLISVARPSVDYCWQSFTDDDEWEKQQRNINRLCNTNIVAGLVLATSAVFVSTQPPLTSFLPYALRGSYIFVFLSFVHALGSMLCGLAVVNIYEACDRTWVKDVCSESGLARIDIHTIAGLDGFALSIVLYACGHWLAEYISLTVSMIFLILAILIACYAPGVWWVQCLVTVEVLSWAWLPPLFVWCAIPQKDRRESRKSQGLDTIVDYVRSFCFNCKMTNPRAKSQILIKLQNNSRTAIRLYKQPLST